MADLMKFRTAINGFNRSDVVSYIESTAAEQQTALDQLKQERDSLSRELDDVMAQMFDRENREQELQQQLDDARAQLAQAKKDLEEQTNMSNELLQQLDDTETALKSTQSALEEALIPDPVTEEEAKAAEQPDYASMELEAYRRAEAMERLSAERTARLRQELGNLLEQVSSRYEQTGQEIEVLSSDIRTNLQRLTEAMTDLDVIFEETTNSFEDMEAELPNPIEE